MRDPSPSGSGATTNSSLCGNEREALYKDSARCSLFVHYGVVIGMGALQGQVLASHLSYFSFL